MNKPGEREKSLLSVLNMCRNKSEKRGLIFNSSYQGLGIYHSFAIHHPSPEEVLEGCGIQESNKLPSHHCIMLLEGRGGIWFILGCTFTKGDFFLNGRQVQMIRLEQFGFKGNLQWKNKKFDITYFLKYKVNVDQDWNNYKATEVWRRPKLIIGMLVRGKPQKVSWITMTASYLTFSGGVHHWHMTTTWSIYWLWVFGV